MLSPISQIISMCLNPKTIRNPKFGKKSYVSEFGSGFELPSHLTAQTEWLTVPCGKCPDCRDTYYNSILQRALVEARSSYMYFVTLTYDNQHVPNIILPTGERIMYSDYSDVQHMFKRLRNSEVLDRDFRYLSVQEYGDQFCRPHLHLLIFVAKLPGDAPSLPYTIERLLFTHLRKFFARNIGSRKQPKYECLFTYKYRITSQGLKTNYFVKYVEPKTKYNAQNIDESDTFIRTIRYLIGYINKGSSFDRTVLHILDNYTDLILVKKLRHLLCSSVRYSKGFGCGFVDGKKFYLPKISVRCSSNQLVYSDLIKNLPERFEDFEDLYPQEASDLMHHINRCKYRVYKKLEYYIKNMSHYEYYMHVLYLKYFPKRFEYIYDTYYRIHQLDCISYFFQPQILEYKLPTVTTVNAQNSDVFKFLRAGVEEAISLCVPYLAFKTFDGFTALCRYYKQRVCSVNDLQSIFNRLNIVNYEQYKELFQRQKDLRKANQAHANRHTHQNDDQIIWKNQKSYLNLPRQIDGIDVFLRLI